MKRNIWVMVLAGLVLASGMASAGPKKGEKAPDWVEFVVLRGGEDAGTFGFNTTTSAASGNLFSSAKLDLKTGKGKLAIQTHVELTPDGKLEKYRKWVGKEGAQPDVIAFWMGKKLRVVSKLKGAKFTSDLQPADGFVTLDRLGFAMYAQLGLLWKKDHPASVPCLFVHRGKMGDVAMKAAGTATLKNLKGEEVKAEAVEVSAKGFKFTMFLGEKPVFLGFQSSKISLVRKGWNLVSVDSQTPVEPVPEEVKEVKAEEKKAEEAKEPETTKKADEAKEPETTKKSEEVPPAPEGKQDLPPLPD